MVGPRNEYHFNMHRDHGDILIKSLLCFIMFCESTSSDLYILQNMAASKTSAYSLKYRTDPTHEPNTALLNW